MTPDSKQVKISAQPTTDPDICKFTVDHPIYPDGSFNCRSKAEAEGSPLLETLFEIGGVSQVFVHGNTLTVAKSTDDQWQVIGKKIGAAIREQIQSGNTLISPEATKREPDEDKIRSQVEELFESKINPALAAHGGFVKLTDVKGTVVYVTLGGGCQGCASAAATLKLGVEQAINDVVPEVTEVIDVTDHSSGANPYYK